MTDRDRFYSAISQFGFLVPLWDMANHEMRVAEFESRLATMSSGESHIARFMAAVWFHDNRYHFELFDAMGSLSGEYRSAVLDWVNNPYYP